MVRDHCDRIEVVGSIRRKRPVIHDIDVVAQPIDRKVPRQSWFGSVWETIHSLHAEIDTLIVNGILEKRVKSDGKTVFGPTIMMMEFKGVPLDLYVATTETWGGLLLVRTGSVEHNVVMTSRAKANGWILRGDGTGVWNSREEGKGVRLDDGTERGIFKVLGVPYREPPEREVPK